MPEGAAAGIALVAPDGLALFVKRSGAGDYSGVWCFPGGMVEDGEKPIDAAGREFLEETGHEVEGPLDEIAAGPMDGGGRYTLFTAPVAEPFIPALNEESSGYAWAPLSDPPQPLHPGLAQALDSEDAVDGAQDAKPDKPPCKRVSKAYARYTDGPVSTEPCADCVMYRAPADCTKVDGGVSPGGHCRFFYQPPIAVAGDGALLAFDRSPVGLRGGDGELPLPRPGLAFDRGSVRSYDADGRLRVEIANISKANICPYMGKEIPDFEEMGLEPDKVYQLLRAPDEIAKAAPSFNNLPILSEHVPVSAADHRPELVIGSTGSDASFEDPYLRNGLIFWSQDAIDDIEAETKKELSSAYRYRADMTPGQFQGKGYDGVMRDLVGNHVALVKEGRAGTDVVVGDQQPEELSMASKPQAKTIKIATRALRASGAIIAFVAPKLAKDAKLDFKGINAAIAKVAGSNLKTQKPAIIKAVEAAAKGKLAQDASLDGLASVIDMIEAHKPDALDADPPKEEHVADPTPSYTSDPEHDALPGFLKGKLSEDDYNSAMDILSKGAKDEKDEDDDDEEKAEDAFEVESEEKNGNGEDKRAADEPPPFQGKPKTGGGMDKKAMDAAIGAAVKGERANQKAIREAEKAVRPYVGELNIAFDSAEAVFRHTLEALGVKTEGVHKDALRPILDAQPVPGKRQAHQERVAMDSKGAADFETMYPGTSRIGLM